MRTRTLSTALAQVTERLASLGADARDEASWLVMRCLAIGRAVLASEPERPVDDADWQRLESWAARRAAGEPLAYLTGEREFWSLPLQVTPAVLVPRPETELLVERALAGGDALQSQRTNPLRVLDLGTGSGAIALAIAHERNTWDVTAIDQSSAALAIARANATRLDLGRVRFLQGDWFAPLVGERFDLIASNPPYVAADDPVLQGDSLRHEPYAALTPGADALAALRSIIAAAPRYLAPLGRLLLEHGHDQGPAVRALLVQRGFTHVVSHPDLAGHERVTQGSLPGDLSMLRFETTAGRFDVELFEQESPETVANFLRYVDEEFFDGTIFHRVIPGFMIQGGGMLPGLEQKPTHPPIRNEAANGLENLRGTLAMARTNDIHSATAQFFVNLVDNDFLDHAPGNYGYAVFGRVTDGMDVVDAIAAVATGRRRGHSDVPVEDVVVTSVRRIAQD